MAVYLAEECKVKCPECNSGAVYRYGKARTGKQRFLCIVCRRQFTYGARRVEIKDKPLCPECGEIMSIYRRDDGLIRFRCSAYPACRTFKIIRNNKEVID